MSDGKSTTLRRWRRVRCTTIGTTMPATPSRKSGTRKVRLIYYLCSSGLPQPLTGEQVLEEPEIERLGRVEQRVVDPVAREAPTERLEVRRDHPLVVVAQLPGNHGHLLLGLQVLE